MAVYVEIRSIFCLFQNKSEDESLICRYYIAPNEELFNLWYENGNRISYVVYE